MEFTSSYFHAFGNPDLAAVVSGDGGSAQAHRPRRSTDGAKAEDGRSPTTTTARRAPSMFCVPDTEAEEPNSFLDECTLCRKALCGDIFMYRSVACDLVLRACLCVYYIDWLRRWRGLIIN